MRPDQLDQIRSLSTPAVHPDGTWAVVAVTRADFASDDYTGQLWRIDLTGDDAPRRITRGFRDSSPRFSPDGTVLAFLRAEQGGKAQVWAAPTAGGEPSQLTDARLGVGSFDIAEDVVVFAARVPAEGRYGTLDDVDGAHEDPRRVTTLKFQYNGAGYTLDKPSQIFAVDLPDLTGEPPIRPIGRGKDPDAPLVPAARQLTDAPTDCTAPRLDGTRVVYTSARGDDSLVATLFAVDVAGGQEQALSGALSAMAPFVHTGRVYFLGQDFGDTGRDFVAKNPGVFVVDGDTARRLTPDEMEFVEPLGPGHGETVLGIENYRGAQRLWSITASMERTLVLDDDVAVVGAAAIPGSEDVLCNVLTLSSTGELWRVSPTGHSQLTDFSAGLPTIEPRPLTVNSGDGVVHGWVVAPEGDGPHPVLLTIHGGPYASYHSAWFDEAQVYAAAGYAVVMCNPRGSAGYGPDHGRAIQGDFGNLDMTDVLTFLDHALSEMPSLDRERVGVMGGSYGGYLSAWLISHTDRFTAAIVERAYLDPRSFVGASDIGWFFAHGYNTDDPERMDAQSPMHLTDRVHTPTFIIHSEQDLRCPIAQALRYYAQLKLAGVETEMLIFPGENHELSRSGTPWHRRQRFEAILEWWGRHLPV